MPRSSAGWSTRLICERVCVRFAPWQRASAVQALGRIPLPSSGLAGPTAQRLPSHTTPCVSTGRAETARAPLLVRLGSPERRVGPGMSARGVDRRFI